MKKWILLITALLMVMVLMSCYKTEIKPENYMEVSINGKTYSYTDVKFTKQYFCGDTIYSIAGLKDSAEMFLISLVSKSFQNKMYDSVGWNYFGNRSQASGFISVQILITAKDISGFFSGDKISGSFFKNN